MRKPLRGWENLRADRFGLGTVQATRG